jgi:hypothetical protein
MNNDQKEEKVKEVLQLLNGISLNDAKYILFVSTKQIEDFSLVSYKP